MLDVGILFGFSWTEYFRVLLINIGPLRLILRRKLSPVAPYFHTFISHITRVCSAVFVMFSKNRFLFLYFLFDFLVESLHVFVDLGNWNDACRLNWSSCNHAVQVVIVGVYWLNRQHFIFLKSWLYVLEIILDILGKSITFNVAIIPTAFHGFHDKLFYLFPFSFILEIIFFLIFID